MFKDTFKDLEMRVFLAHLVAFLAVTAILAGINLWLTPQYPWWVWVLIGWGAAVATHAFALLLRRTRRRERIFIDRKTRSFAVHLFAYLAAVLILLFVNLTVTPKVWWFFWVALGWGIGIVAHGWCAFGKKRPLPAPQGTPIEPAQERKEVPLAAPRSEAPAAQPQEPKAKPTPKAPRKRSPRKPKSEQA